MLQWIVSALVQIMACRLFEAKPLPEPMLTYCQLDSWEQISVKFELEFYHFHSRKCIWKCGPTKSRERWVKRGRIYPTWQQEVENLPSSTCHQQRFLHYLTYLLSQTWMELFSSGDHICIGDSKLMNHHLCGLNILRLRQNVHFAEYIFDCIFLCENISILFRFLWNLFPRVQLTVSQL